MRSPRGLFACLVAVVCASGAMGASAATSSTSPVAFVYVATVNSSGVGNQVVGFATAADGTLTAIPGSPWADKLQWMAATQNYLFGSDFVPNGKIQYIFSYKIQSDGSLHYIGATDIQDKGSGNVCNDGTFLTLDHTGSHLYQQVAFTQCGSDTAYESWGVNKSTGLLDYLGTSTPRSFPAFADYPLTVAANNLFAYAVGCDISNASVEGVGFKKQINGNLADLNLTWPMPTGEPPTAGPWTPCPSYAAADPTNHLAVAVNWLSNNSTNPEQIATYAVNATTGALATSSTYDNMPTTSLNAIQWMSMSPSGKFLAAVGGTGLQLFNFNPTGQATPASGVLIGKPIAMCAWDNANHLYALVRGGPGTVGGGLLYMLTVTASGATQVPGSPYSVPSAENLLVQTR